MSFIYNDAADGLTKGRVGIASSAIAVPVDVQYSAIKAEAVQLCSGFAITGTAATYPATKVDWSAYGKIMLRVDNTHNQAVDLTFQLQDVGEYSDMTGAAIKVTIPASKSRVLVTSKELPLLEQPLAHLIAIRATCAVAPTGGGLTIIAHVRPVI